MHVAEMNSELRFQPLEAICWHPPAPDQVMAHHIDRRMAHVFRPELSGPLMLLQLLEGQDTALLSAEALIAGSIWSAELLARPPRWVDCMRP